VSHELETINVNGQEVASFSFSGLRKNIWHRLGQQFGIADRLMSAQEAMEAAHMDRTLRVVDFPDVEGVEHWSIDRPSVLVLEGKMFMTEDGQFGSIPDKVVGLAGNQAVQGHAGLTMLDRFQLAEAAIHASQGAAVWSTAGLLRDGTQGFATMEAPPIVIDPNGIKDVIQQYLTLTWSFNGSRKTELGASNIRVVCANTQAMHDMEKRPVIGVKMTSGSYDRMQLASDQWARAQDEGAALALQAERMLAVGNGSNVLKGLCEEVLGITVKDATLSKRARTIRENKLDELRVLYHASTNSAAVGDNGYAAFQTVVEYLDWFSPVKADADDQAAVTTAHVANQFDGTYDSLKAKAAEYVLAVAS
jgi:hypothetical protein